MVFRSLENCEAERSRSRNMKNLLLKECGGEVDGSGKDDRR